MDTSAKVEWIMDCASRLAELRPDLTPDQLDDLACRVWERCHGTMDAKQGAEAAVLGQLG